LIRPDGTGSKHETPPYGFFPALPEVAYHGTPRREPERLWNTQHWLSTLLHTTPLVVVYISNFGSNYQSNYMG
jgi:hypothetical protein